MRKEHQFKLAQISKVANLEGGPYVYYSSPPFRSPRDNDKNMLMIKFSITMHYNGGDVFHKYHDIRVARPHVYYSSPPFRSPLNDEKHHVDDVYPCDDDVLYYNDDISTMCSTLFIRMVFSLK